MSCRHFRRHGHWCRIDIILALLAFTFCLFLIVCSSETSLLWDSFNLEKESVGVIVLPFSFPF
jgi:hypothetical protein